MEKVKFKYKWVLMCSTWVDPCGSCPPVCVGERQSEGRSLPHSHSSSNVFTQLQTAEFPPGVCGLSRVQVIRSDYWPNVVIAYKNNHSLVECPSESQCKYEPGQERNVAKTTKTWMEFGKSLRGIARSTDRGTNHLKTSQCSGSEKLSSHPCFPLIWFPTSVKVSKNLKGFLVLKCSELPSADTGYSVLTELKANGKINHLPLQMWPKKGKEIAGRRRVTCGSQNQSMRRSAREVSEQLLRTSVYVYVKGQRSGEQTPRLPIWNSSACYFPFEAVGRLRKGVSPSLRPSACKEIEEVWRNAKIGSQRKWSRHSKTLPVEISRAGGEEAMLLWWMMEAGQVTCSETDSRKLAVCENNNERRLFFL